MKKFLRSCRGALAVFMSIIIIPLITITSAFVDSSKIILARSLAESAGDLALNTVLTNFDKDLNEYFGLIASAQSTDEAMEMAKQFFVDSMLSQATEKESSSGINAFTGIGGNSKSFGDFLGLQVNKSNVTVKALDNGSLANPAILKKQIVEFNKYRAPMNALSDFFEWLTDSKKQMDELDDITDMTEKKNVFYEEESDFVDALKKLWDKLKDYDEVGINGQYITDLGNKLKTDGDIDKFYTDLHTKIIYEYLNVYDSNGNYLKSTWSTSLPNPSATKYPTVRVSYTTDDGTTQTKNVADIEAAIKQCAEACRTFKNKETGFLKMLCLNGLYDSNSGDIYEGNKNNIYNVQYWALAEKVLQDNKSDIEVMTSAYYNMIVKYKTMNSCFSAYNNLSDEYKNAYYLKKHTAFNNSDNVSFEYFELDKYSYTNIKGNSANVAYSGQTRTYSDHVDGLKNFAQNAKSSEGTKEYLDLAKRLNNIYENIISGTDSYQKNGNIKKAKSEEMILKYSNDLTAQYDKLQTAIDRLTDCLNNIQGNGLFKTSLYDKLKDYDSSFKDWDNAVQNLSDSESEIVELDRNEVEKKKNGNGKEVDDANLLLDKIKESDIKALETRLTNVKTLLVNCQKAIKNLKYCGKSIIDITNLETAMDAVRSAAKKASVEHNSFYKNNIAKLENIRTFTAPDSNTLKVTNSNNPDLAVNSPKLRTDIYEFFKNQERKKDGKYTEEEAKDKKNAFKDSSDKDGNFKTESSAGASKNEIKGQPDLPSGLNDSEDFSSKSSDLKDISKTVGDLFKDLATDVRDDLLVSDYIMRMFSYDTFEKELLLNCASDDGNAPKSITEWNKAKGSYTQELNTYKNTTWWGYNKNLRNLAISKDTCYSYLNEVEYVLYGGNNAANKTAAYCYIYAIRFACDLSPVFSKWYKDLEFVTPLATSISSATMGVLPIPLVKTLICIALTCVEAGFDMSYIKEGFGIEFFKKKTDLFCSFSADDISSGESEDGANGIGFGIVKKEDGTFSACFRYSDYINFFLIMKLMGGGESDVLKRTGDVIQMNMRQYDKDYLLKNSQVYFNLSAEISIKPLMLSQPINASSDNPFKDLSEIVKFNYNMSRGY